MSDNKTDDWYMATLATAANCKNSPPVLYCRKLTEDRAQVVVFDPLWISVFPRELLHIMVAKYSKVTDVELLAKLRRFI